MAKAWRGIPVDLDADGHAGDGNVAALYRLEVWGRELGGSKGSVAARSACYVAWVASRHDLVPVLNGLQ